MFVSALPYSPYDSALIKVVLPVPLREPSPPKSTLLPKTKVSSSWFRLTACVTLPTLIKFLIVMFLIANKLIPLLRKFLIVSGQSIIR